MSSQKAALPASALEGLWMTPACVRGRENSLEAPGCHPTHQREGPGCFGIMLASRRHAAAMQGTWTTARSRSPSSLSSVGAGLGVVWWVTYCVSAQLEPTPCCPYQIAKARVVRGDTGLGRWASGEGSVCQVPCTPAAKLTPRPRGCSPVPGRFRPMRTRMTCLEGKHAEGRGRTCRVMTARRSCS